MPTISAIKEIMISNFSENSLLIKDGSKFLLLF